MKSFYKMTEFGMSLLLGGMLLSVGQHYCPITTIAASLALLVNTYLISRGWVKRHRNNGAPGILSSEFFAVVGLYAYLVQVVVVSRLPPEHGVILAVVTQAFYNLTRGSVKSLSRNSNFMVVR